MKNEFIPYEQALELKELGFDEPCLAHLIGFGDGTKENGRYKISQQQVFYPNDTSPDDKAEELGLHPFVMCGVPLYQQAFRWFREKHNLDISINTVYSKYNEILSRKYSGVIDNEGVFTNVGFYDTYEEAELTCLKKMIEMVKSNTDTR
jgi:hypothetical protein